MKKRVFGILVCTLMISVALFPVVAETINKPLDSDSERSVVISNEFFESDEEKPWPYKPSARCAHTMVYNNQHGKLILFGGEDRLGRFLDDTWVYDYGDNRWTQMNPSMKPSARAYHAMTYDSKNDKVILFGGRDSNGFSDETWVYDYQSDSWVKMSPTVKPAARYQHAMVYESRSGRHEKVVLFGGEGPTYGQISDETWVYEYESNTWTQMNPSRKPPKRARHTMVCNKELLPTLFGGYNSSGSKDDTWGYALEFDKWTRFSSSFRPSNRTFHSMAFSGVGYMFVLFGGYTSNGANDETWVFEFPIPFTSWELKFPSTKPSPRYRHAMIYDEKHNKIVLFGGDTNDGVNDETWEYDYAANTWTELHPKAEPSASQGNVIDQLFLRFLEDHLHLFPILQRLLKLLIL